MTPWNRLTRSFTRLSELQAIRLQGSAGWNTVQVKPPDNSSLPATLDAYVRGILELQTKYFGLKNASPVTAFEIRRPTTQEITLQYSTPTERLERKIRTHLHNTVPGTEFKPGVDGLPVETRTSIGGGLLTTGRPDHYPLETEYDHPPINAIVNALHRHAIQDTGVIIQILFQPVIGQPLRRWWWTKQAYHRIRYLRKHKEQLWGNRPPTPREKTQADAIEHKAGNPRFHTTIRFLFIGAADHTPSRLKELAGAFNIYENPDTGQYLDTNTIQTIRHSPIHRFAQAVNQRQFAGWSHCFQLSTHELAALLTLPDNPPTNLETAQP